MNYYIVGVKKGYYSAPRSRTYLVGAETADKAIAAAANCPALSYWEIWQDKGGSIDEPVVEQVLGQDPTPYLEAIPVTGEGVLFEVSLLESNKP